MELSWPSWIAGRSLRKRDPLLFTKRAAVVHADHASGGCVGAVGRKKRLSDAPSSLRASDRGRVLPAFADQHRLQQLRRRLQWISVLSDLASFFSTDCRRQKSWPVNGSGPGFLDSLGRHSRGL